MLTINKILIINLFVLIIFFILKLKNKFFNCKSKKKLLNFEKKIEEESQNLTLLLIKEYNEPLLLPLKGSELFSYYNLFIKKYLNTIKFDYIQYPLISIIIPVYNGENYLIRSLLSIEAQSFKNIEIIYVDDFSNDNSILLIKNFQLIDSRIKLFINKENKGTLYTKSFGVSKSKGKYILVMDQDDIYNNKDFFKNIIKIAEEKNLDIVQFRYNDYIPNKNQILFNTISFEKNYNNIIVQPELGDTKLYLNEKLYKSFFLWDKLIKRKTYLKAIDYLGEEILNKNMVHREDHIMTYALYKMANNYMKINLFGYTHIANENQESNDFINIIIGNNVSQNKREKMLLYQFEFGKFIFNITKETNYEKKVAFRELLKIVGNINFASKVYDEYIKKLVIDVCNSYLKSFFLSSVDKQKFIKFLDVFYSKNFKIFYTIKLKNILNTFIYIK